MALIESIRVLIVDDEPDIRVLTRSFLQTVEAMEVDAVGSVREAMTEHARRRYDVIVSDYHISGENGIQFLRSLRASGDDVTFILFTSKGDDGVAIEALNNGANYYLRKGEYPAQQYAELSLRICESVQAHRDERRHSSGPAAPSPTSCDEPVEEYPIASDVITTIQRTIAFDMTISALGPLDLSHVSEYRKYGYGTWKYGAPIPSDLRTDIMPPDHASASVTKLAKLLTFFAFTDIHITDKESPSQLIYIQQLNARGANVTSIYSPVMLYTTQVLDAAIQTVNALHKRDPFDFGISLGDTCNSTQFNELRWYIDVLDGKVITPSSGAHVGADTIDYQRAYKAAGLDRTIPWYQVLGNHDHFWIGSIPVSDQLRRSYISDIIIAAGDVLANPANIIKPEYYMGVLDGSTPYGDIIGAGPVGNYSSAPKVVADPDRRSLLRSEWIKEFFESSSDPVGHGFNLVDPGKGNGFACYSFVPRSTIPIKIIVLDDTQLETDGSKDIHGHGFLDQERYDWLKKELAEGQAADQLMIIAAHIPIGVQPFRSELEWWVDPQNAVTLPDLIAELQDHPNLIMWIAGHRHYNTVKAFISPDPVNAPEKGFWQVETSSLRDYPQQFRTFEIYLNSDLTISIVTINVDPAVEDGTPAARSRSYAVAAQQIVKTRSIYQDPSTLPDPSIRPMPTASYNAELVKQLSPLMRAKMQSIWASMRK